MSRPPSRHSLICCRRFRSYVCDLYVAAAFLPLLSLCCMRFSRLRLRPLCRRRLLAFALSVVCLFAATSTTFVSPPPSCFCSLCCMRFSRLLLRPLCRCFFLLFCFVACGFAATSATFVSPPLSRPTLLCFMRFRGYFCDLCVAAAFSPCSALLHAVLQLLLRPLCRRRLWFRFYVPGPLRRCRLPAFPRPVVCVSATFLSPRPSHPSSRCCWRFAATSATFVSPPPSLPSLRWPAFLRLLLRPLCRRLLLSLFALLHAVSRLLLRPLCRCFFSFFALLHAFSRLLLRPLCRRRFLALPRSVVCIFAAIPVTFASLPFSRPSSRCCMRCRRRICFRGYFCDLCVAAAFLSFPLPVVCCMRFLRLLLRPFCRSCLLALLCFVACGFGGYFCDLKCRRVRYVACGFAATSANFVSPPTLFSLLCPGTFVSTPPPFSRLCSATFVSPPFSCPSLFCCMPFCGYFCDLCVAAAFSPSLDLLYAFVRLSPGIFLSPPPSCPFSLCASWFFRLFPATFVSLLPCFSFVLLHAFFGATPASFASPLSTSALPSPQSCPFFARRVPVHQRCVGSSSALQCCAVPSFACRPSATDLPAWVARALVAGFRIFGSLLFLACRFLGLVGLSGLFEV